jgi:flavin reductase (DIM6/NTAB) family NADH-FMN oxidoreductase RutF
MNVVTMRKRPWNRVNLPVYSISSGLNEMANMNICTYATAVSMEPKHFLVAVYHHTRTLENIRAQPRFILQLLAPAQYNLVALLGKQHGNTVPKIARLQKRNLLTRWNDFYILKDALAVMELETVHQVSEKDSHGSDHTLFLCRLIAYKNLHPGEALTLDDLRVKKIIRS